MSFPERVRSILERDFQEVFSSGGVIAVSGGADSVALLRCLCALIPKSQLHIAHLNHQLRGSESDQDENFVCDLAKSLSIPYHSRSQPIASLASEKNENLEDVARNVRYQFLQEVAKETQSRWIATAHHADDQAETILHRLIRGTGLQGLRGIAKRRELSPEIRLIRPLISFSRTEIVAYLDEIQQPYREDSSNVDLRFTRNRIRQELLPLLRTYNPGISEVLFRLANQAEETFGELESQAKEDLTEAEMPRAHQICILKKDILQSLSRNAVRNVFRQLWVREAWPIRYMSFDHWDRIAQVVFDEAKAYDLPEGISIRAKGNLIQIGPFRDGG
jgi:tRNA(Ile)-lysidine synthase